MIIVLLEKAQYYGQTFIKGRYWRYIIRKSFLWTSETKTADVSRISFILPA